MQNVIKGFMALCLVGSLVGDLWAQAPADQPALKADTAAAPAVVAPTQSQPAPADAQIGLVPETAAAEAKPAEVQPAGTTLKLTPSIMVKPLGVDKLDKYGPWMILEPELEFGADFLSATNKTLSLSLDYSMEYKQYIGQHYEKFFTHNLTATGTYNLNPKLSVMLHGKAAIAQAYSSAQRGTNNNTIESGPGMTYKLTPELTLKLGYYLFFQYKPNLVRTYDQLDPISNPPSDMSDLRSTSESLYYYSGPEYALTGTIPPATGEQFKIFLQGITTEVGYKFSKDTSFTLKYHFYPYTSSNDDTAEYTGHQVYLILTQNLWKDGSIKVDYRLRYVKHPYSFTDIGNEKQAFRHRLWITLSHKINDMVTLEGYYGLEYTSSNAADPSDSHEMYLGVKLSF